MLLESGIEVEKQEVAEAFDTRIQGAEGVQVRNVVDACAQGPAFLEDAADFRFLPHGQRDVEEIHGMFSQISGQIWQGPEHRLVPVIGDGHVAKRRLIVEKPEDPDSDPGQAADVAGDGCSEFSSTDDDGGFQVPASGAKGAQRGPQNPVETEMHQRSEQEPAGQNNAREPGPDLECEKKEQNGADHHDPCSQEGPGLAQKIPAPPRPVHPKTVENREGQSKG